MNCCVLSTSSFRFTSHYHPKQGSILRHSRVPSARSSPTAPRLAVPHCLSQATGGTCFLCVMGELPLCSQAMLLRLVSLPRRRRHAPEEGEDWRVPNTTDWENEPRGEEEGIIVNLHHRSSATYHTIPYRTDSWWADCRRRRGLRRCPATHDHVHHFPPPYAKEPRVLWAPSSLGSSLPCLIPSSSIGTSTHGTGSKTT